MRQPVPLLFPAYLQGILHQPTFFLNFSQIISRGDYPGQPFPLLFLRNSTLANTALATDTQVAKTCLSTFSQMSCIVLDQFSRKKSVQLSNNRVPFSHLLSGHWPISTFTYSFNMHTLTNKSLKSKIFEVHRYPFCI